MQISENCTICNKPSNQMLMLACVHDPCINCAASSYAQQTHIKNQSKEIYLCEVCNEATLLDSSTIAELATLAASTVRTPSKKPNSKKEPPSYTLPAKTTQPTTQPPKKVVYYCKQHPQEEISYYCFRCWINICPECAIHGEHKEHQVKLIKKAVSEVRAQYQSLTANITQSQSSMNKLKDQFLRVTKETNQKHMREKHFIAREFQQLKSILQAKEKQLLLSLDQNNKNNTFLLTTFLNSINDNYEEINKVKRTIDYISKKDQVLILQDFRRIGELEEKGNNIVKNVEVLKGESMSLHNQLLQQDMNQVVEKLHLLKIGVKKQTIGATNFGFGMQK